MNSIKAFFFHILLLINIYLNYSAQEGTANKQANGFLRNEGPNDMRVLVEDAVDWAQHVGLKMRTEEHRKISDIAAMIPFTLFPSPVPRALFEQAYNVHTDMALLYFRVASDYEFLVEKLSEIAKSDGTVRKLLALYQDVHRQGIHQPINMMWMRSDYMFHKDTKKPGAPQYILKQIEANLGAATGFDVHNLTSVHRRVLSKVGIKWSTKNVPDNTAYDTMAQALFQAWKAYGNPKAIMVMQVMHYGDIARFEENPVEYRLEEWSKGQMKIVRLTLGECYRRLILADDFTLRLDEHEVAVVYYRHGRTMNSSMITDQCLETWGKIERSKAIKSTSLGMDLASTKKIQQVLAEPGVLERFFPSPKDKNRVAAIRATFAGMWALERDDEETEAIIKEAIAHPDRFVLKPNRDGGGNNFWDEKIAKILPQLSRARRARFILMQRLRPMVTKNYFITSATVEPKLERVTTELGTYGFMLGNVLSGTVLHNKMGGHLMRTKLEQCNESGVCAGSGIYDSPLLF